jgi:hypothetical protein
MACTHGDRVRFPGAPSANARSRTRLGRGPAVSWVRRVRFPSRALTSSELGGCEHRVAIPKDGGSNPPGEMSTTGRTGRRRSDKAVERGSIPRSSTCLPVAQWQSRGLLPLAAQVRVLPGSCGRVEGAPTPSGRGGDGHPAGFGRRRPLVRLQPTRYQHLPTPSPSPGGGLRGEPPGSPALGTGRRRRLRSGGPCAAMQRGRGAGCPREPHELEIAGSNPARAIHGGRGVRASILGCDPSGVGSNPAGRPVDRRGSPGEPSGSPAIGAGRRKAPFAAVETRGSGFHLAGAAWCNGKHSGS